MLPAREVEEAAAAFARACDQAGVAYALVGGMAVNAWGSPRATRDIDCLLDLPAGRDAGLTLALRAEEFRADGRDSQQREDRSHVSIFDERSSYHIDCKLARSPEERAQVAEACEVPLPKGRVRVARPEDTLAYKVKFGSPQDLADTHSIAVRQAGKLDEERLVALALQLGVAQQVRDILVAGRG
jgi:hypothetical protein